MGTFTPFEKGRRQEPATREPAAGRQQAAPWASLAPVPDFSAFSGMPRRRPRPASPPTPARAGVQAKLQVGRPNDPFEREADELADEVLAAKAPCPTCAPPDPRPTSGQPVQRRCSRCAEEEEAAAKGERTQAPVVMRKAAADTGAEAGDRLAGEIEAARGGGGPLPPQLRQRLEHGLRADLAAVRVHADDRSGALARDLGALAFTRGADIFFARGQFAPASAEGQRLIAHEVVHTVQQRAVPALPVQRQTTQPGGAAATCGAPEIQRDEDPAAAQQAQPAQAAESAPSGRAPAPTGRQPRARRAQWKGDLRSSLFAFLRQLGSDEEEAARVANRLDQGTVNFTIDGRDVTREAFEAKARRDKAFAIFPSLVAALLDFYGIDEATLDRRAKVGATTAPIEAGLHELLMGGPDIPNAKSFAEELKKDRQKDKTSEKVVADLTVLADPALAGFYLTLMQHYGALDVTPEMKTSAGDGLSTPEIEAIVGKDPRRKFLTAQYTQAYRELTAAGKSGLPPFSPLAERIIEQTAFGNPTATHNLLKIGEGFPERGRVGIAHRSNGVLLYDEHGDPLPSFAGTMMRDEGFVGAPPPKSFGIDISGIDDPALKGILNALRQTVGDPTRAVTVGAQQYFDNMEFVNAQVIKGLPKEVIEKFEDMLPVVLGFAAGHALAAVLTRLPPPWPAIGLALKGILKGVGYVLQLDFAGSALDRLLAAGFHLSRLQRDGKGELTELSKFHIAQAAAPLRSLVADIAAMVLVGKLMEALRGGKRGRIKCASPCDTDFEGKKGDKGKSIDAPTVKRPTPEVNVLIDAYVEALSKLGEALSKGDGEGKSKAQAALDKIEHDALENHGKENPLGQLVEHIDKLTEMRSSLEKGDLRFPYEETKGSGKFVEGIGRKFEFMAAKLGLRRGMTYAMIEKILGWPPNRPPEARPNGATRLSWVQPDGSVVILDIPGPENSSPFEISRRPHLALVGPAPYEGLHVSENGVGVPANSTPAHIEIQADAQLTHRVEPLKAEAAKTE